MTGGHYFIGVPLQRDTGVFSGIQISILNVLEPLIPNDQKKYNNTEVKSGDFYAATALNTRCCEYKKIRITVDPSRNENCRLGFCRV